MAIAPAPASVSINQVNVEIGRAGTYNSNMNEIALRTLAGVSTTSGVSYSMDNFRGKSSYTPMTPNAGGDYVSGTSSTTGSSFWSGYVHVAPTGGTGGYTYAWTVTSNPAGMTIGTLTGSSVQVSKTVAKFGSLYTNVVFSCTITDNTSHQITVTGVTVTFEIDSSA